MEDLFSDNSRKKTYQNVFAKTIDLQNPFDNSTEKHYYNEGYDEIVPEIKLDGYELSEMPSKEEKKKIRHFYNIGGFSVLFNFGLMYILSQALTYIIMIALMIMNNMSFSEITDKNRSLIINYMSTSSISPAITTLSYLAANLIVFFVGAKFAKINLKSLFKPRECTIGNILQYIFIAIFLQYSVGILSSVVQSFMQGSDIFGASDSFSDFYSTKYAVITILYSCIVAPVTEELLCRGLLLKVFSRVSQRFGIFMSALFFGLGHGNIAQFALGFIVGIFMGYIVIKHNSIIPSIIVHMAVNILSISVTVTENLFNNSHLANNILSIIIMLLVIVGLTLFIFFCKKNVFPKNTVAQQFRCKGVALKSVGVVLAAAMYIFFTISVTFS